MTIKMGSGSVMRGTVVGHEMAKSLVRHRPQITSLALAEAFRGLNFDIVSTMCEVPTSQDTKVVLYGIRKWDKSVCFT